MKYNVDNVIEVLIGKHTNKKIIEEINKLKTSEMFNSFIENNEFTKHKTYDFYLAVNEMFVQLVNKNVSDTLILNLYDETTLIFIILSLEQSSSWKKRLHKIILDIIINSHKFEVYKNTQKTVRKIANKDGFIMEFFWLIPLFINTKILSSMIDDWRDVCEDFKISNKENPYISQLTQEIICSKIDTETNVTKLKEIIQLI